MRRFICHSRALFHPLLLGGILHPFQHPVCPREDLPSPHLPVLHLPSTKDGYFPLLGQTPNLIKQTSPVSLYLKWANLHPTSPFIRVLGIFNSETLLVVTPEAHKEILHTHCYSFIKPDIMKRYLSDFLGERGVLFLEGDEHKFVRRQLNSIFSLQSVKKIMPVFQKRAGDLTAYFEKRLDQNGIGEFDINTVYSKATIDVTGAAILGVELGNLTDSTGDTDFLTAFHRLFMQPPLSAIISFINLQVPIRRFLPFVKANTEYLAAGQNTREMTTRVVRRRMTEIKEGNSAKNISEGADLLTMMIENEQNFKEGGELTEHEIVDQILTFLAASHETSADAMLWASFVLATRPDIQSKLRGEILGFLQSNPNKVPGFNDIESLRYLNNFIREILRLYSPAIQTFRESIRDLAICGQVIPKGTVLHLLPSVASTLTTVWGEDGEEFVPERWDDLPKAAAEHPYAWSPFLGGPRICPGKQFALTELKVFLMELVPRFRFKMTEDMEGLQGKMPRTKNPASSYRLAEGNFVRLERIY
ncbi:putative cytochrome P450 E-class, group I [Podospora australis]|uniref:Cytochrome P450 E-class, group I n=1 Tax=Podospora australis TaxID=1536484 RepID=A0AAN7AJI3_9PEZI|nr:putative cytochrome P450 E-class, group I [Podospora australis]